MGCGGGGGGGGESVYEGNQERIVFLRSPKWRFKVFRILVGLP